MNKFQCTVLDKIRDNHNFIIAHAHKGLDPVGVETTKSIFWALKDHLLDKTTYTIIPEEQVLEDVYQLYDDIQAWASKYFKILSAIN